MSEDKDERLFQLSAIVGEALQRHTTSPVDATLVLMVTLGRLLAREGFSDLSVDAAWASLMTEQIREAFKWGHEEERARGHHGAPRKGEGRG